MYHLVYTSYSSIPFGESILIDLLNQSRESNKRAEITGMLLYVNGKFMQVLEGKRESVLNLFEKIENDARHKRVRMLIEGESPNRLFDRWSMGFKRLSDNDFKSLSGFQDTEAFFLQQNLTEESSLVMVFLQLFYKKNFVDYPELAIS